MYVHVCVFLFLQKEVMASSSSLPSMDWGDSSAQSLRGKEGSKASVGGSIALLRVKKTKKVSCIYVFATVCVMVALITDDGVFTLEVSLNV